VVDRFDHGTARDDRNDYVRIHGICDPAKAAQSNAADSSPFSSFSKPECDPSLVPQRSLQVNYL
jgi:hypothetical protein